MRTTVLYKNMKERDCLADLDIDVMIMFQEVWLSSTGLPVPVSGAVGRPPPVTLHSW
jgi:hypothetical protein